MLFKPELIEEIKKRHKTQTRRLVKPGDQEWAENGKIHTVSHDALGEPPFRQRYRVGQTYAICPGRGKPAVGRIQITEIGLEYLQDISDEDLLAEGIDYNYVGCDQKQVRRHTFRLLWDRLNPDHPWQENPEVWVLTFELVK